MRPRSERVVFPGADGQKLAGNIELPGDEPLSCALFAHCFTCSKDTAASSRISRALRDRGLAVLRFDFTGLGGSEGDFANTNFSSNVADLVAAADYLRSRREAPALLVGHSLGGAAVLVAAQRIAEVRAVATIGAPSRPQHLRHLLESGVEEIERAGEATINLAGRRFRIRKQLLDDLDGQEVDEGLRHLGRALLIMHSPVDGTVDIEHAATLYRSARHPKSFVSLDTADHLLSRREDADYVAEVLAAWASRYVTAG